MLELTPASAVSAYLHEHCIKDRVQLVYDPVRVGFLTEDPGIVLPANLKTLPESDDDVGRRGQQRN